MNTSTDVVHYICCTQFFDNEKEDTEKVTHSRDIKEQKFPQNCVRFRFYDKLEAKNLPADSDAILISPKFNESPIYYIGEELNIDQIVKFYGKDSDIYTSMITTGTTRVVKVCTGDLILLGNDKTKEAVLSPEKIGIKKPQNEKRVLTQVRIF